MTTPDLHDDEVLSAVVVGSGFSGIGMAIRLRQDGVEDFVVLEKAEDLGGTWRDNRYPGCACDVPARLYSYSFAPNPDWSRTYAPQQEIWDYIRDVATRYGVLPHLRYGAELVSAAYDEPSATWTARTADGRSWRARALVLGTGALHEPLVPDLPGLETFEGTVFHSAQWPDGDDGLTGRRVAVVGTGASAVQFLPKVAERATQVHVFQRTPSWIMPRGDKAVSPLARAAFRRFPVLQRLSRLKTYLLLESRVLAFVRRPQLMKQAEKLSRRHLERSVSDPAVREALTPSYRMGCKRVLVSDDYWPTYDLPHVELLTGGVARVEPGAVVGADGSRREVDAVVLGTGFHVTDAYAHLDVVGPGGRTLKDAWAEGMRAHLGVSVAGFPNLFLLVGPNSGLGHSSMILMIESQVGYVAQCLKALRDKGIRGLSVRTDRLDAYEQEMQRRTAGTVWASGCRSWYLDEHGRNAALWPGSTVEFRRRTRTVRPDDLEVVR